MKEPAFGADGYPTDDTLDTIRKWPCVDDPTELIRYVISAWYYPDRARLTGNKVYLSTGGWSGNESLIDALHDSMDGVFWTMCWQESKRGGHYWFRLPEIGKEHAG